MNKIDIHAELSRKAARAVEYFETNTKPGFQAQVAKDPVYAMEWADGFLTAAAEAKVWGEVAYYLTRTTDVKAICDELLDRIVRAYTPSSTSRASNAMLLAIQEATRRVYRELDQLNRNAK